MNVSRLTAAFLFSITAAASANPIYAAEKPDTVRLTYSQAFQVAQGLAVISADGYRKAIKDGGVDKNIEASWSFSANTRRLIAKDFIVIRSALEVYDKARIGLTKQYFGVSNVPPKGSDEYGKLSQQALTKFEDEIRDLAEKPLDEDVQKIAETDLKLDDNPIQAGVLANLDKILIKAN